jgi:Tfp pilus assembly protein PilF
MRTWPLSLLLLALAGCATTPEAQRERLFADRLFNAPSQRIDAAQVFAPSDEMRAYLAREIGAPAGSKGRQQALVDALRKTGQLKLEYEASYTRNAAQAFESRSGNCLSLLIMTASLARQLGIPVRYRKLYTDEPWDRQGDMYFSVGHVNLTLGGKPPQVGTHIDDGEQLIVDFLPPRDLKGTVWHTIDENTVLAMYMNNRAAESLTAGKTDDAYWYAREAVRQDPEFVTLYNTLGVIYLRRGHPEAAEQALAFGLQREPRNTKLMSNMAIALARQGRAEEAQELELRLAQIEPEPPFTFFNRGVLAMRDGNYQAARDLFAREIDRAPYYHEFHFWLALALYKLGDVDRARKELALAMENSTTRRDLERYAAKLASIKASALH